jgi:hypothetical protein
MKPIGRLGGSGGRVWRHDPAQGLKHFAELVFGVAAEIAVTQREGVCKCYLFNSDKMNIYWDRVVKGT